MTKAEFDAEVVTYLHADGTRRGIEGFRAAYSKAALIDLAAYIPELSGKSTWQPSEQTPFDSEVAETVAEYMKVRIVRGIDRDIGLSQQHAANYAALRRRLYLRIKEGRSMHLSPWVGKPFTLYLTAKQGLAPISLAGDVCFTVKALRTDSDCGALMQLTVANGGIDVTNPTEGKFTVVATSEATRQLVAGTTYLWDVQVQNSDWQPVIPDNLSGSMIPRQPITRDNP